jgi:hypothetical protein
LLLAPQPVYDRCARRHPVCQNPRYQASALAYGVADAATHEGHRAGRHAPLRVQPGDRRGVTVRFSMVFRCIGKCQGIRASRRNTRGFFFRWVRLSSRSISGLGTGSTRCASRRRASVTTSRRHRSRNGYRHQIRRVDHSSFHSLRISTFGPSVRGAFPCCIS